jgi:phosphomevalonate kinase
LTQYHSNSLSGASRNKFVETALAYALSYISTHGVSRISPATITILADDDYYSQSQTSTKCPDNEASRFQNFNVSLGEAHKTGLGSSAALVTAFVSSLLAHYIPESRGGTEEGIWRSRIHNLAQAAHCTAQGKIGSGFDVAAAVFGSCVYRRFSPSVLEEIGRSGTVGFSTRLRSTIDDESDSKQWDTQILPSAVRMPKRLRLVMCDVDCGSETPGMVRKVFAWRKEKMGEALLLWETLHKGNQDLAFELERLADAPTSSFENLETIILTIRSFIRDMSDKAGVPIEPLVQTELLDACTSLQGVVGGVVPGAGGYDALALVLEDNEDVLQRLTKFLDNYNAKDLASEVTIGKIRLLGVKQEMQGLASESTTLYKGWL